MCLFYSCSWCILGQLPCQILSLVALVLEAGGPREHMLPQIFFGGGHRGAQCCEEMY